MSRIISGLAGSIKLKAAAKSTRPTSDRVKESLFAKLEHLGVLEGAKVLDLYAGSGALGLEAASRGAAEVILVEKDKAAAEVIRENVIAVGKSLGRKSQITLVRMEVSRFLRQLEGEFDLIFMDPPYQLEAHFLEQCLGLASERLKEGSLVCIERGSSSDEVDPTPNLRRVWARTYGSSTLTILERVR